MVDRKEAIEEFHEVTGWKVNRDPISCWHVAVGRKCPGKCNMHLDLPPYGPADHPYTSPLDHPRRAWTPNGERVMLCSTYVLDQRGATALSEWCTARDLVWTAVPASWYWPGVTLSVVVRDGSKSPHNWVPDPIRWERWKR